MHTFQIFLAGQGHNKIAQFLSDQETVFSSGLSRT